MDLTDTIDNEFSQLASLADDRIDLAHGALLIAKAAYPDLNESLYLERLDRMASRVKLDMTANTKSEDIITKLNYILFEQEKFRGNRENYYDPDNSFLNRVIDRKTGIPITLSLIYIEVAGRLGLDVRGIGLPGHFITALYHASGKIFIDPFNRGEIRTVDECLEIVRANKGKTVTSDLQWLQPIGRKELLARMLRNLKLIYARQDNDVMLFKTIHWILTLQPEAPAELSARAMLYEAMGNPSRAVKDWQRYIANIGDHESVTKIRARIDYLKKQPSRIH
ncbi:MAG: transglutaminase-like domain-containing protein [Deltaproteobacteria bacterium]|nr:transglutaminase-like domain-containing protein [Deltaproteobacteria bacterium]